MQQEIENVEHETCVFTRVCVCVCLWFLYAYRCVCTMHLCRWIELFGNRCQCVELSNTKTEYLFFNLMGEWQTFNLYLWLKWIYIAAMKKKNQNVLFSPSWYRCMLFAAWMAIDHVCVRLCEFTHWFLWYSVLVYRNDASIDYYHSWKFYFYDRLIAEFYCLKCLKQSRIGLLHQWLINILFQVFIAHFS